MISLFIKDAVFDCIMLLGLNTGHYTDIKILNYCLIERIECLETEYATEGPPNIIGCTDYVWLLPKDEDL